MAHSAIMSVRITGNASEAQKAFEKTATKAAALGTVLGNLATKGIGKIWDTVKGFSQDVITMSDSTDKFKSTLKFAGLDTSAIDKATKATRKYADTTVYGLDDIQSMTAQLAANGIKDYLGLTEAAGNLNAVAGGNAETFKSVAMVMTQTAGAGKLTTENWNQLSDAIPGASGRLQDALRKNGAYTGDFRDAMAKGQITAAEFNDAIMQLGMSDVAKEAAASTATMEGAIGNLEAAIVGGLTDAFNVFKPMVTSAIGSVGDFIADFSATATRDLQAFAKAFTDSGAFETGRVMFNDIADACKAVGTAIWDLITAVLPIDGMFNGAADAGGKAGEMFNTLTELVGAARIQLEHATDWIRQVAAGLRDTGAAQATRAAWDAIVSAGHSLWDMCGSIAASLARVWQGMAGGESVGSALGGAWKTVTGIIQGAADALGRVADWFGAHADAVVTSLAAIGGGFAAFKIAGIIQTAVGAIQGFSAATKAAELAQAAFNVVMNANPVMVVVTAIGALVAGLTYFFTQTETGKAAWAAFTQFLTDSWNAVAGVFQVVCDAIKTAWDAVCQWVTAAWQTFMDWIQPILDGLKAMFEVVCAAITAAWDVVGEYVRMIWETVKDYIGTVVEVIRGIFDAVCAVIRGDWSAAGDAVKGIWDAVRGFFERTGQRIAAMFQNVVGIVRGAWDGCAAGVRAIWQAVQNFFGNLCNGVRNAFNGLGNGIRTIFTNAGEGVKSAWNGVLNWFRNLPQSIMNIFANAGQWLWNAGSNIINGLWDGLKSAWGNVTGWVGGLGDWIAAHKGPPAYDKTLLVTNGKLIMQGLARGLTKGFDSDVRAAVSKANASLAAMPLNMSMTGVGHTKDDRPNIVVNINGKILDEEGTAAELRRILDDYATRRS